ncbi:MAG: threonylcarbamoyl-AMP synthase [Myxococcales bacterium]|nr:threonylcarbamoyl-AMP synthase [Myxococcales bacterium]
MHLAAAPIPPHVLVIGRRPRPNSALPVSLGTDISHAADVLRAGGLVAFPTETVYGLGADATSAAAVARVFAVKGRPRAHPLIVHLAGADDLGAWTERPGADALALARAFWPGPLTLIVRRGPGVLDAVSGGAPTVGLRVPAHPMARALLAAFGGGVAAPSANRFGAVSPTTAAHVVADLGDDVDYVLDGGPCQVGVESTIVDLAGDAPALLRPGGIARAAVEAVLGRPLAAGSATPAPGTLPSHYAPRARVVAVAPAGLAGAVATAVSAAGAAARIAVLAPAAALAAAALPAAVTIRALPDDDAAMAHDLYAALRELDRGDVTTIVAALPAEAGLGAAVADRLRRAAGPRTVEDDLG